MSNEAAFDNPSTPEVGSFGLWQPGMDLVVRFADTDPSEELGPEAQRRFVDAMKALAEDFGLTLRDWGPAGGMVAKILMESDDDDPEPRLRDMEAVLVALVDSGAPLPERALPAVKRITERVQTR